jgi:gas vesicle protein
MSTTKMIVGILGAAAAGVIIGMLTAPEKGEDLRNNIKRTADDWIDEISKWAAKGKEFAQDLDNRAMETAGELKEDAEDSLNDTLGRRRS